MLPTLNEFLQVVITFLFVTIGWVFFRSETIKDSIGYLFSIISDISTFTHLSPKIGFYILILILVDWTQRYNERNLFFNFPKFFFRIFVLVCIVLILISFKNDSQQFIYFDF